MQRRAVLAVVGAVATTGCLSSVPGTGESEPEPEYEMSQKESMLLTESDFPEDWERLSEDFNEESDRAFGRRPDVVVLLRIGIHETVSSAADEFEQQRAGVDDPNEYPIGDEAIWYTRPDNAQTLVRDSNAIAVSVGYRRSGGDIVPDPERSQTYAEAMVERWETL